MLLPVLAFASHLSFVFVGRETVVDISGVRPAGRFPSGYAVIHSNASYRIPVLPTPNHHIAIRPDPFSKAPSVFPQPIHTQSSHLQHLQGYTSRILQEKYLGPTTPYPSMMPLSSPLLRSPSCCHSNFRIHLLSPLRRVIAIWLPTRLKPDDGSFHPYVPTHVLFFVKQQCIARDRLALRMVPGQG